MHGFCGESISKTRKKTIVTVQNEVAYIYIYRERRKMKQNKQGRKKTTLKILVFGKTNLGF
jgi:hypothetical protein